MKKVNAILVLLLMMSLLSYSQDILIDFSATGVSSEVNTVEIVNLSNCTSIEVPGNAVVNLTGGTVGISNAQSIQGSSILNYPNPFVNSTNIILNVNQDEMVNITASDITGKIVASFNKRVSAGINSFEFTANNDGIYFVHISGKNISESLKVICLSNHSHQAKIAYSFLESADENIKQLKNTYFDDFIFNEGDTLKLEGISGDYATIQVSAPTSSETYIFNFVECTDGDNNHYSVVSIGNQTWMGENIKSTTYANGESIPLIINNAAWAALEDNNLAKAYCYYDNDSTSSYGALYTYAAATNGNDSGVDVQGVCPKGWHIPSMTEWETLLAELHGENIAGGKLKSSCFDYWEGINSCTSNESGFTALPGGVRDFEDGLFGFYGLQTYMWSSTPQWDSFAWKIGLFNNLEFGSIYYGYKSLGFSVRCVQD